MKVYSHGRPWRQVVRDRITFFVAGGFDILESVTSLLNEEALPRSRLIESLQGRLRGQNACFGLIAETPDYVVAISDHVRSYPIFLKYKDESLELVSTQLLEEDHSPENLDTDRISEFLLCGYVLSDHTVFRSSKILSAGQILVFDRKNKILEITTQYQYIPLANPQLQEDNLLDDFGGILDSIFQEIVNQNRDRAIWLPLSGGLDSRLVLTKLVEHGHEDITTFSFGVPNNHEIRRAKKIAKALDVKWLNVPSRLKHLQEVHQSTAAQQYSHLCFSGQSSPIWLDFEAVNQLLATKLIPGSALFMNGYSGDFLFGGHIPQRLYDDPTLDTLCDCIVAKHCSHFLSPYFCNTELRIRNQIKQEFQLLFGNDLTSSTLCSFYEHWDWKERQVKAVVMGQRLYDHFGLEWMLPFWDRRLMDFWSKVPSQFKLGQKLHIQYLRQYNYRGAFTQLRSANELWSPTWKWVPLVGNLLQLLGNSSYKDRFYSSIYFYGFHHFQLGLFGKPAFKAMSPYLRRPYVVPLSSYSYLKHNGFPIVPDELLLQTTD